MTNTPQSPETTLLHMSLLSWKNGDITMIELKKLINTLMISRKAVEEALGKDFNTEHTMDDWKAGYNQAISDIRKALGMDNVKS